MFPIMIMTEERKTLSQTEDDSILKIVVKAGMVTQPVIPVRYGGGGHSSRSAWQKVIKTPISKNKLSTMVHACNPSYEGGRDRRRLWSNAGHSKKFETLSKR
jgi:hypothetical protein